MSFANYSEMPTTLHQQLEQIQGLQNFDTSRPNTKEKVATQFTSDDDTQEDPAGKTSIELYNEVDLAMHDSRERNRKYNPKGEKDRKIHYSHIQIKDHNYYNKKDNLWNEPQRLDPKKFAIYSEKNIDQETTFKKTIKDLPKIISQEKEEQFISKTKKIEQARKEEILRYNARKLERQVWQFQASQGLNKDQIQFIQNMAEEDPNLFEELASKKKWTYVVKNPERAMKDAATNNQYWNLLNNLPRKRVGHIVTDSVLKMDKRSCENLLKAILEEKKEEDFRKQIAQKERIIERNKTVAKHNQKLSDLASIGVKIRDSMSVLSNKTQQDFTEGYQTIFNRSTLEKTPKGPKKATYTLQKRDWEGFDTGLSIAHDVLSQPLDKYAYEKDDKFLQSKIEMKTQYSTPKTYKTSDRTEILAMPKTQYHGKDFFQRQEFRGLFLADHQEALGQKAFQCVDQLNISTVNKFNSVNTFKESISSKKTQENFYKANTQVKQFMHTSYKNNSPRTAKNNRPDLRLEGALEPTDHHYTIEEQRKKMAQTFQHNPSGDNKLLPQVVTTPHQVKKNDDLFSMKSNIMNMTGGLSTFTNGQVDVMRESNNSFSKLYAAELARKKSQQQSFYDQETLPEHGTSRTAISQVPQNSSKIDFKLTFPQPSIRKKMASTLKQKQHIRQTSFGQMTVPKTQQIMPHNQYYQHPSPKHLIGTGYQHSGLSLSFRGQQHQLQGVFVKSSRSPILTLDHAVQGPCPPSLREYTESGRLLSDPVHSLAAITHSTKSGAATNLNPEKLKDFQARTLANQNSCDLFQSKQFLIDHTKTGPQAMVDSYNAQQRAAKQSLSPVAVKSIKSISTRKKSVFK